jgi:twitching motility protein PilT
MPKIDQLFEELEQRGGSDLHLSVGLRSMIRLHGDLVPLRQEVLTEEEFLALVGEITPPEDWQRYLADGDLDFAYETPGRTRFRINLLRQYRGRGGVFRIIPPRIQTLRELGLPPQLAYFTRITRGLVLVTGPTGCGKSTTLAAVIDEINTARNCHIVTIEDPIEFVHENKKALITQREVGLHAPSFAEALRAAVREDPDVILVGEMRDLETIDLALTCAEMGFLVFATLHTNSAPSAIDRIIDVFPAGEQEQVRMMLSESLAGVVAQQLLKRIDQPAGRIAIVEILFASPALSNIIREGKTQQIPSLQQTGKAQGMITMDQALLQLVEKKIIHPWDAAEVATDRTLFAKYALPEGGMRVPASLL